MAASCDLSKRKESALNFAHDYSLLSNFQFEMLFYHAPREELLAQGASRHGNCREILSTINAHVPLLCRTLMLHLPPCIFNGGSKNLRKIPGRRIETLYVDAYRLMRVPEDRPWPRMFLFRDPMMQNDRASEGVMKIDYFCLLREVTVG